jgi:hypothetical protein
MGRMVVQEVALVVVVDMASRVYIWSDWVILLDGLRKDSEVLGGTFTHIGSGNSSTRFAM